MIANRRGQGMLDGLLAMLVFVMLAAVLVDVWTLYQMREFGYRVARDAAFIGASRGRDWLSLTSEGIRLNAATAQSEAEGLIATEMAAKGITGYTTDVRVLADYNGGTIAGYPPLTQATTFGSANWTSPEPAVGVYLELPVTTAFLGILNGNAPVTLHVFAAAGVANP